MKYLVVINIKIQFKNLLNYKIELFDMHIKS